jgi:copper ion binding protein
MKKVLSIEGMSCAHCVARVESAISEIQGVTSVQVDLAKKSAVVDGGVLDDTQLKEAVADAGYEVVAISQ